MKRNSEFLKVLANLIPLLGERQVLKEVDERLDKNTIIAVLFGIGIGEPVKNFGVVVTNVIIYIMPEVVPAPFYLINGLLWVFLGLPSFVIISAYWDKLQKGLDESAEKAKEKKEEIKEKGSE